MCSINWEEFLTNAKEFVTLSDKYQDGWTLIEKDSQEGNAYLVFRQKIRVSFDDRVKDDELIDCQVKETDQGSVELAQTNAELVDIEYHVVYSISYQVPVLYFKGYRSDGTFIGLDDAWRIFQSPIGDAKSRKDMLSTLTQSDHPVLFKPFLGLHPCRTAELLNQMGPSRNTVLTFLSIMGPYVRLNLRNEYGLAFQEK